GGGGKRWGVGEGRGFGGGGDFAERRGRRAESAGPATSTGAPATPPAGGGEGGGRTLVQGLPIVKPPYGTLSAINLDKGEITWQVPHGATPDVIRNHPLLKGMDIPQTGQNGAVGLGGTKNPVIKGD